MSQFYARYVPSATNNGASSPQPSELKRPSSSKSSQPTKKRKLDDQNGGEDVLAKYSSTQSARNDAGTEKVAIRKKKDPRSTETVGNGEVKSVSKEKKKSKSTRQDLANGENGLDVQDANSDELEPKHKGVLSRMKKYKEQTQPKPRQVEKEAGEGIDGSATGDTVHPDRAAKMDLGPIPQPEQIEPVTKPPLYSTVPEWVQNSIRVDEESERTFEELGLREEILNNVRRQGKNKALPVQSTVLPLLVSRELERRHDICVAAATGSGKTLAYVLPILESLYKRRRTALRAVIVVPTRALVKQVLHTLETCSVGLDVRLGSVEGSQSLEEERKQLVHELLVYDPDEYRRQQESAVDWSTFSLEDTIDQAYKKDLLATVGHVYEYLSKVDILVATPGRLIEHLQSTRGFNLDHVEWFVADEADRLLNESYHDWLDVVLPALKSQKATERRDELLEQMKMDVPKRRVTKILLSATMTNDIQQLMSLELHNPKLVLMENANAAKEQVEGEINTTSSGTEFTLPMRLQESAIAFKDSDNKPLYLLELLNQHILNTPSTLQNLASVPAARSQKKLANGVHQDSSLSSSSDSSSDSESDSSDSQSTVETDEDSNSDTDSDTSIDSTSSSSISSSPSSINKNSPSTGSLPNNINSTDNSLTRPPKPTLPRALIFTKSTESAHRLARLLCLLSPSLEPITATLTRSSSSAPNTTTSASASASAKTTKRQTRTFRQTLASFTAGNTRVLISTDLSSRGLDIPSLEHVVNYDVPASALTYVHRVGRTARAGRAGSAWTLVEHKQGKWFWETIAGKGSTKLEEEGGGARPSIARSGKVGRVEVKIGEGWKGKYENALKRLEEDVVTTRR